MGWKDAPIAGQKPQSWKSAPIVEQQKTQPSQPVDELTMVGRGARSVAAGLLAPADLATTAGRIPYLAGYGVSKAIGYEPGEQFFRKELERPLPSQIAKQTIDTATGGRFVPPESDIAPDVIEFGAGMLAGGPPVQQAGANAVQAIKQFPKQRRANFIQSLITPKETPSVRQDIFSRSTEQGLLRTQVPQRTKQELSIADDLSKLKISPMKSLNANYNVIKTAVNNEARALVKRLQSKNISVDKSVIENNFNNINKELSENLYITGDGEAIAKRVLQKARELIDENGSTAHGILNARKELDNWVISQRGKNFFGSDKEGPVQVAVAASRRAMNNIVAEAAPDEAVKRSLQKQSNFYTAMDNILTKGGDEGRNVISRAYKKVKGAVDFKTGVAGTAAAGAGAAAYLAGSNR